VISAFGSSRRMLSAPIWRYCRKNVQAVLHFAALPEVRRSWGDRLKDYLRCSVPGTQRLLPNR